MKKEETDEKRKRRKAEEKVKKEAEKVANKRNGFVPNRETVPCQIRNIYIYTNRLRAK